MKKTILLLIFAALSIGAMAQTWMYTGAGNTTKARKATDSYIGRWSVNTIGGKYLYHNGKLLISK